MNRIQTLWNKAIGKDISKTPKEGKRVPIAKTKLNRIRQDAATRKAAIEEAELALFPFRVKLQQLYLNTAENGYIKSCIERRNDLTLLRKWAFKDANGNVSQSVMDYFFDTVDGKSTKKEWFNNFITYCLDAQYYGYSLIYLGDVVNNSFPCVEVVKRWHISPDRFLVSRYEYITTGCKFMEEEGVKDFHVYVSTPNRIGTSICGYGLFYELSVYENLMRNLLGFNGDYVEVNVVPFRQIKTYKTEESEREELFQTALNIASCGVAITDPTDEIIFHQSGASGTGYNAYDNFESRLKKFISQLILGHADAMESIPGKLGNDSEESPAQQALEDKQTKDGEFILAIVNKMLIPKMRALGFSIPEGVTACLLNDNEDIDNADNVVNLAVKMKSAGLQMEPKFFTEKTGIPVAEPILPTVLPKMPQSVQNKLKTMYNRIECNHD